MGYVNPLEGIIIWPDFMLQHGGFTKPPKPFFSFTFTRNICPTEEAKEDPSQVATREKWLANQSTPLPQWMSCLKIGSMVRIKCGLSPTYKWHILGLYNPRNTWRIIPIGKVVRITPILQSHKYRPFGRGPTLPYLGDLRSPWLLTTH